MIWGKEKFFVVPDDLLDPDQIGPGEILVVLTDVGFWAENADELMLWCKDNDCVVAGMTVALGSKKSLTAFCLKWS